MVDYYSRSEIGLVAPNGRTLLVPSEVVNFAWHYPGMASPINAVGADGLRRVMSALRGWQTYHMQTRGWSDIAYQVAVDQVGRAYTLRGRGVKSAANGGTLVNEHYGAALLVLGNNEEPSELMKATARAVAVDYRVQFSRVPSRPTWHGAIRPGGTASDPSTDCPGARTIHDIKAGEFDAGLPPIKPPPVDPPVVVPPPEDLDDDMFITRYGASLYRMFIDRRVIGLSEGTFNTLKDGGVPVRQLSNDAVDALASICETYLKVDTTPAAGTEDAYLTELLNRVKALEAAPATPPNS